MDLAQVFFFQHYWNFIKIDLFNCVLEFFKNGKILEEINNTFITLIPKVSTPTQMHQFRPISLCSIVYKIISKILVNRLRPLLDRIISPVRSAFVPGVSTRDNILLTHEIMHEFKNSTSKTAWTTIKLDMEKAYHRLEWDFILKCFQEMGFHPTWNKWIMEAISSVSYSIMIHPEWAHLTFQRNPTRQPIISRHFYYMHGGTFSMSHKRIHHS